MKQSYSQLHKIWINKVFRRESNIKGVVRQVRVSFENSDLIPAVALLTLLVNRHRSFAVVTVVCPKRGRGVVAMNSDDKVQMNS